VLLPFGVKNIYNWSLTVDASFIIHLYFVKIEPGSTNMACRPGQGKKLVGSWPQDLTGIDATGSILCLIL